MEPNSRQLSRAALALCSTLAIAGLTCIPSARADEGGVSVYLLGSGGPGAAIMPPVEGVFFGNTLYYYDGHTGGSREFVVGGDVVADLEATIIADFPAVIWVPTTDLAGGVFSVGAVLPFGRPEVDVSAVLTGPGGGQIGVSRSDSAFVIGDPVVTSALGWNWGDYHLQASTLINIPIGEYREEELANLAFHRWAADLSLAGTWHDEEAGWDVSAKAGVTFNGSNEATDYDSGNDFHFEAAVERRLSPQWSIGLQGYYFEQISADGGDGAVLGDFEGRVTGFGATAAYQFHFGERPATLRFHVVSEFDAINRLEGDAAWIDLSFPISIRAPPH